MTARMLFDNFDLIADAPGGVPKLRELILQLAVRGKLVPQDPKEGNGQDLLDKIRKKNLCNSLGVDAGGIFSDNFHLPGSWVISKLGEVAEIIRGVTFPGGEKSKLCSGEDVACLRTASVQTEIDWDDLIYISPEYVGRDDQWVKPNDIMISMANSYALVGKVAMVRHLQQKATFGAFLAAIRPVLIDPHFLLYALRSPEIQGAFRATSSQTTNIANISLGRMRPLPFPLPPLPEQKRIVAKVDELMKRCDELEARQKDRAARHKTLVASCINALSVHKKADSSFSLRSSTFDLLFTSPESIDELRKTILQLAVQGQLVPQDPRDESAVITLTAAGVDKRYQVTSTEDALGSIPKSWAWVRFLGVGEQRLGKMLDKAKNQGEMRPYLRNTNVQWMRFELGDVKEMRLTAVEQTELRLKVGDILVCEGGEPGRCAIWNDEIREMYFQKAIHRIRPCSAILSEYIALNLRADSHNGRLATYFTGATIKHFTGRSLGQYTIPVPPSAEQKRIVAKVNKLMALCDKLEAKLTLSRAVAEKLAAEVVGQSEKGSHPSPVLDDKTGKGSKGCIDLRRSRRSANSRAIELNNVSESLMHM